MNELFNMQTDLHGSFLHFTLSVQLICEFISSAVQMYCGYLSFEAICETHETVFHWDIQILRRELKIWRAAEYFGGMQGVWISIEILSGVFDIILNRSKAKE